MLGIDESVFRPRLWRFPNVMGFFFDNEGEIAMASKASFAILVAALVVSLSCEDIGNLQEVTLPTDQELIWVGKVFSGGAQCTQDQCTPPDTKQLLNQSGIAVFATLIEQ